MTYDIENLIEDCEEVLRKKHAKEVEYMIRSDTDEQLTFNYESLKALKSELIGLLDYIREDYPEAQFRIKLLKTDRKDTIEIQIASVES